MLVVWGMLGFGESQVSGCGDFVGGAIAVNGHDWQARGFVERCIIGERRGLRERAFGKTLVQRCQLVQVKALWRLDCTQSRAVRGGGDNLDRLVGTGPRIYDLDCVSDWQSGNNGSMTVL